MASLQQILANRWSFSSIITSTFGVATVIPTSNRAGNWVLKRWINISKVTHLASVRAGISQSPKPIVFLPSHPARDKPFLASSLGDGEEFGAALSLSSVKTTGDSGLRNTDCQALSPAGNMWKGNVQVLRTQCVWRQIPSLSNIITEPGPCPGYWEHSFPHGAYSLSQSCTWENIQM